MPTRIHSLQRYQRSRRSLRFEDLPPAERAAAEGHYQRLCARWGNDLPQWRRAILVGRAKDLVLHPRDARWAIGLRRRQEPAPLPCSHTAPYTNVPRAPYAPDTSLDSPTVIDTPCLETSASSTTALPRNVLCDVPAHARSLIATGVSTSGIDGHDTSERILRDLGDHAFGSCPQFSMAASGKDLPRQWRWRLEVVPVP